ncbi:MAG: metal-sensitive transcriptional regulator [Thermoplasmata archaeon]
MGTRLARIEGHLHAIHRMVDEGRNYPDVVQQIAAVRSSLDSVLQVIVDDLVEDCVRTSSKGPIGTAVRELREVVARAL